MFLHRILRFSAVRFLKHMQLKYAGLWTSPCKTAHLKLDEDIQNISGATLSCRHLTDGVKRLLALYDLVLK